MMLCEIAIDMFRMIGLVRLVRLVVLFLSCPVLYSRRILVHLLLFKLMAHACKKQAPECYRALRSCRSRDMHPGLLSTTRNWWDNGYLNI